MQSSFSRDRQSHSTFLLGLQLGLHLCQCVHYALQPDFQRVETDGHEAQPGTDRLMRAAILAVQLPGVDDHAFAASIAELHRLAQTLGVSVVATVTQKRDALDSAAVSFLQGSFWFSWLDTPRSPGVSFRLWRSWASWDSVLPSVFIP